MTRARLRSGRRHSRPRCRRRRAQGRKRRLHLRIRPPGVGHRASRTIPTASIIREHPTPTRRSSRRASGRACRLARGWHQTRRQRGRRFRARVACGRYLDRPVGRRKTRRAIADLLPPARSSRLACGKSSTGPLAARKRRLPRRPNEGGAQRPAARRRRLTHGHYDRPVMEGREHAGLGVTRIRQSNTTRISGRPRRPWRVVRMDRRRARCRHRRRWRRFRRVVCEGTDQRPRL